MSLTPTLNEYQAAKRDRQFHKDFQYDIAIGWFTRERAPVVSIATRRIAPTTTTTTRTGHRQRSEGARSSAASGDGNSDSDDPDPERRQPSLCKLYDQAALAAFLGISKKTLQNLYSVTPHTLPVAIAIPGARGPRWTVQCVQAWLNDRPRHTSRPAPIAPKKKAGRPRIALASKKVGVQS